MEIRLLSQSLRVPKIPFSLRFADSLVYIFNTDFPVKYAIYLFWGELAVLICSIIKGVNAEKWAHQANPPAELAHRIHTQ